MANPTSQDKEPSTDPQKDNGKEDGGTGVIARATDKATELGTAGLRRTRARLDEQVSQQREQLTGKVRTLGRALHGAGEMLQEDNLVAHGLHFVSDKVTRTADYLDELSPSSLAEDARALARSQPLWFFGGAFTLGLALGRFAKSSASSIESSSEGGIHSSRSAQARTPAGDERAADVTKHKGSGDGPAARASTSVSRPNGSQT